MYKKISNGDTNIADEFIFKGQEKGELEHNDHKTCK